MIDTKNYEWVELRYNYHTSWSGQIFAFENEPGWWIDEEEYRAAVENDSVWEITIKLIDRSEYYYYLASDVNKLLSYVHEKHGG